MGFVRAKHARSSHYIYGKKRSYLSIFLVTTLLSTYVSGSSLALDSSNSPIQIPSICDPNLISQPVLVSPTPSASEVPTPSPSVAETPLAEPTPTPTPTSGEISIDYVAPELPSGESSAVVKTEGVIPKIVCPSPVSNLIASAQNSQVLLSWTPGVNAELNVVENISDFYIKILETNEVIKVTSDKTSALVSGLKNKTKYSFVVYAASEYGSSIASEVITATPLSGNESEVAGLIIEFKDTTVINTGDVNVPGEELVTQVDLTISNEITEDVRLVEFSEPTTLLVAQEIATEIAKDEDVVWAEPDQFVYTAAVEAVNDPSFTTDQWNLWDKFGIGLGESKTQMSPAWSESAGVGINVAVIDTGITSHPDLDSQLVPGFDFVSSPDSLMASREENGEQVSFDGDYVNSEKYGPLGWDANPTDPGDWRGVSPVRNSTWHGTHIAGVIAAQNNNEEGIAGIAPGAKIQPIRALSWRGGLLSDIATSITWASGGEIAGVDNNSTPAKVINMSFSVNSVCPASLQAAINDAFARGSVLVAAAGNNNDDVKNYAPANCENVISVGASNKDGKRASYSNYGLGLDVSAPGGDNNTNGGVLSTSNSGLTEPASFGYSSQQGTSISSAHVSAIAARIFSSNPALTPIDVKNKIVSKESVREFAETQCDVNSDIYCGEGIVSLFQIAAACSPTQTTSGNYIIQTFTNSSVSSCEWTPSSGITKIDALLVAGGGGGGSRHGGGGGAGGVLWAQNFVVSNSQLSISIGSGGAGATGGSSGGTGSNGTNTTLKLTSNSANGLTASGGGGGGSGDGLAGGSGGASSYELSAIGTANQSSQTQKSLSGTTLVAGSNADGTTLTNYGNNGGKGIAEAPPNYCQQDWCGGGGGGAGAVGGNATISGFGVNSSNGLPGNGGVGIVNPISGSTAGQLVSSSYYLAGGGGGASSDSGLRGSGGSGGGGAGGNNLTAATAGTVNTGGGGGGGGFIVAGSANANGFANQPGGRGGSGVLIIRYLSPPTIASASISGTQSIGSTLTASAGSTTGTISSTTYQWQYSADNSSWTNITGATSSTYTISGSTYRGNYLRAAVTVTNDGGSATAYSTATSLIYYPACSPTQTNPTISGVSRTVYSFTTTGTCDWTAPASATYGDLLVVGGGGGGGINAGSGGGGGGSYYKTSNAITPGTIYTVNVGAGGTAGTYIGSASTASAAHDGGNGGTSSIVIGATTFSGSGGTGGQTIWANNICGGSGLNNVTSAGGTGSGSGGTATTGGTGAGGNTATNGGAGLTNSITGTSTNYAAGGSGGYWTTSVGTRGGDSAGNGGNTTNVVGGSGAANRGGGGGGGAVPCVNGGAGGSGVVIVSVVSASPTVTGISPSTGSTTSGGSVTITGTNFVSEQTTATINGVALTSVNVSSSTSLTATLPTLTAGTHNLVVDNGGGSATSVGAFTVLAAPTIGSASTSGNLNVGSTLTATANNVTGTSVTTTYQWQSSDSVAGTYSNISGATNSTFEITSTYLSKYLRVVITVTNAGGSASATSTSNGSMLFAGTTSSYLSIPNSTNFKFGTGNFTVEWWQYQTDSNNWPRVFEAQNSGGIRDLGVSIEYGTFYWWTGGSALCRTTVGTYKSTWLHFAVSRSGTTTSVYKNGALLCSFTDTRDYQASTALIIGNQFSIDPNTAFGGNITDFHWVKGTALYTSDFTVSSTPTTSVTNSKLLLNAANSAGVVTDSTSLNTATNNSVTWSSMTPFLVRAGLSAALTPTFGSPASTADGFTVTISNYDASYTFATPTVSAGSVAVTSTSGANRVLTVTGLSPGTSATITQQTSRTGYTSGSATVTGTSSKSTPTLSSISNVSKTYGDSTFSITAPIATVSSSTITGSVSYISSDTSVASVSGNTVTVVGVGTSTFTATFTPTNTSLYNSTTTTFTITVAAKLLTITAEAKSKSFGASTPTNSYTLSTPLVGSDAISSLTYTYSGTNSITAPTAVGSFTITPSSVAFSTGSASNYSITYAAGSYTIGLATQSSLTVSSTSGTFGSALTLTTSGGTGDGSVTFVATTGTASSCTVSGTSLTAGSAGTCFVTATKAADSQYSSISSTSTTVTFAKASQSSLTVSSTSGTFGTPLTLTTSGGSGDGAVTFVATPGDATSCSVSGSTLTAGSGGTCLVTATKATSTNYLVASSSQTTVTFAKRTVSLSGFSDISNKTYGDTTFTLTAPSVAGSVAGAFSYASGTTSVATISGSTVTIVGAGTSTITATFTPTDAASYDTQTITMLLTINKKGITVTAGDKTKIYGASTPANSFTNSTLVGSDAISSLTYTYSGTNSTTAPTSVGNYTITPSAASFSTGSSNNYTITYVPSAYSITKATPTFSGFNNVSKTFGDGTFTITAPTVTGSVSGAFTYVSSDTSAITISGTTVTVAGSGSSLITASFTPTDTTNYNSATTTMTISVAKANQNSLSISSSSSVNYGSTIALTTSGGSGNGAVSFAVTSGTCSTSSTTLTPGNAGSTCVIQATKALDANYNVATSSTQSITVNKLSQTVSFTSTAPSSPVSGDTYTPLASASSGAIPTIAIASSSSSVCSISAGIVTFNTSGTCLIEADSASSTNYNAATTASQSITVAKIAQTITFTQPSASSFGDSSRSMSASSSSGLALTYSRGAATTNTACSVDGSGVVTILAVGDCEVTAVQSGNSQYNAAVSVSRTFAVNAIVPSAPFVTSVSAGNASATVSFSAPSSNGGANLSAYEIVAMPTSGSNITKSNCSTSASPLACTITGLTNGTTYTFKVAAINSAGTSAYSTTSGSFTPATIANSVVNLVAQPGDGTLIVNWDQPTDLGGGSFTRYDVYYKSTGSYPGTPNAQINSVSTTTTTFSGLTNGTSYDVKVVAITSANASELAGNTAEVSQYPSTVASAPTNVAASKLTATSARISWGLPLSDGGASLDATTPYVVTITGGPSAISCGTLNGRTCDITDLNPSSTYSISVKAQNRMGLGTAGTTTYLVPSNDANLLSINLKTGPNLSSLSNANFTPTFDANTTSYSLSVANTDFYTAITPTINELTATIKINGVTVTSGAARNLSLGIGANVFTVEVTAGDLVTTKTYTLTITRPKASQMPISITSSNSVNYGSTITLTTTGGSGNGLITFAATGTCTTSFTGGNHILTPGDVGSSCSIVATKATDDDYFAVSSTSQTITINKTTPTLSDFNNISKTYGDPTFTLNEPSVSGNVPGSFAYFSSNTGVVTVSGATITVVGQGSSTITATFTPASTTNYYAVTTSLVITVAKKTLRVTPGDKTKFFGASHPAITKSVIGLVGSEEISTIDYTYEGTGSTTYAASTTNPTNAGTYSMRPVIAGLTSGSLSNYDITYDEATFTINKVSQSALSITSSTSATFGVPLTLSTSGGSGTGAITFTKVSGDCTLNSSSSTYSITPGDAGNNCVVSASKAADTNYNLVSTSDQTITIGKANQTLTFTSSAASTKVNDTYTPVVTSTHSSSGVSTLITPTITIDIDSAAICSISAGVVTFDAAGSCVINADAISSTNYNAATTTSQTITVTVVTNSTSNSNSNSNASSSLIPRPTPSPGTRPNAPRPIIKNIVERPAAENREPAQIPNLPAINNPSLRPVFPTRTTPSIPNNFDTGLAITDNLGRLPLSEPGEKQIKIGNDFVPVIETVSPEGAMTLTIPESANIAPIEVAIQTTDIQGQNIPAPDDGIIRAVKGQTITVAGDGLTPGTTYSVWLFSEPTKLGEGKVMADTSFNKVFLIPDDLPTGSHTLQINGINSDKKVISLTTGVILTEVKQIQNVGESSSDLIGYAILIIFFLLLVIAILLQYIRKQQIKYLV